MRLKDRLRRNAQNNGDLLLVVWAIQLMLWSIWSFRAVAEGWHPVWVAAFSILALGSATATVMIIWVRRNP